MKQIKDYKLNYYGNLIYNIIPPYKKTYVQI